MNLAQIVEVGPIVLCLRWIGRPLHSIVQLTADARLVQIDLHVAGVYDFLGLRPRIECDTDETVAGQKPGPFRRGSLLDAFGDDALRRVDPIDTVPRWGFLPSALPEIED